MPGGGPTEEAQARERQPPWRVLETDGPRVTSTAQALLKGPQVECPGPGRAAARNVRELHMSDQLDEIRRLPRRVGAGHSGVVGVVKQPYRRRSDRLNELDCARGRWSEVAGNVLFVQVLDHEPDPGLGGHRRGLPERFHHREPLHAARQVPPVATDEDIHVPRAELVGERDRPSDVLQHPLADCRHVEKAAFALVEVAGVGVEARKLEAQPLDLGRP